MKIFQEWTDKVSDSENQDFFSNYLELEKNAYQILLSKKQFVIEGKISELATSFKMDVITFAGFLDGVNSSLKSEIELDSLTEEDEISIEIDAEKLLYNMHEAKANWLYQLPEWEGNLTVEQMLNVKKQFNVDHTAISKKVGRNELCPCGSGKKYKKCCGK